MLNAIADSTVLVSAFLRKEGVSAVLLRHAAGGAFALSLSQAIVTETETVLLERGQNALRADSWNINSCLRGRLVGRLRHTCPV